MELDAPWSELKCDLKASKAHCSIFSSLQILSTLKFHFLLHFTACTHLFHYFLCRFYSLVSHFSHLPMLYLMCVLQIPHHTCLRIPLQWKKEMLKKKKSGNQSDMIDMTCLPPSSSLIVAQYFILSHKISFPQWLDGNPEFYIFFIWPTFTPAGCNLYLHSCQTYPQKTQTNCNAMLPSATWRQLFLASIQLILSSKCEKRSRDREQEGGEKRRDVSESAKLNE